MTNAYYFVTFNYLIINDPTIKQSVGSPEGPNHLQGIPAVPIAARCIHFNPGAVGLPGFRDDGVNPTAVARLPDGIQGCAE